MHGKQQGVEMDLVKKAEVFATAAHASIGQKRKYTFEPYIVHPRHVSEIVSTVSHTPEMLAAAWLHDTVEDTGITNELITEIFGNKVGELVGWLTDTALPGMGNRALRMEINKNFIAAAPWEAQTVKVADIISNCSSIMEHDENFARVYLQEKRAVLEVLVRADATLMARARALIG